jgi:hypothetical protein
MARGREAGERCLPHGDEKSTHHKEGKQRAEQINAEPLCLPPRRAVTRARQDDGTSSASVALLRTVSVNLLHLLSSFSAAGQPEQSQQQQQQQQQRAPNGHQPRGAASEQAQHR